MIISKKQIEAVLKLDGDAKYRHFIKRVTNTMEVFALYDNGWALALDGESKVFPVFPAKEYAELLKNNEWANYEATMIPLDEFINDLLPKLQEEKILIGVLYSSDNLSTTSFATQVISDINIELENYQ